MEKKVTVIENNKDGLKVGCDSSLCSGCKSEMFCRNKDSVFTVENPSSIPLNKGDKVTIEIPEGRATLSVILSLALPLLLFLCWRFVFRERNHKSPCWLLVHGLGLRYFRSYFQEEESLFLPYSKE